MNYLTRKEQERVAAFKNWPTRKLNEVENLVLQVKAVAAMPGKTQKEKPVKEAAVEELVSRANSLTATERLGNKIRLACYSEVNLEDLLNDYVYAKFPDIIGANAQPEWSAIERAALNHFLPQELRRTLDTNLFQPRDLASALFEYVPKGVKAIVYTRGAHENMGRIVKAKLSNPNPHPALYGITLPDYLQGYVNDKAHSLLQLGRCEYSKFPNITKRLRIEDEYIAQFKNYPGLVVEHNVQIENLYTGFYTLTKISDPANGTELYFML